MVDEVVQNHRVAHGDVVRDGPARCPRKHLLHAKVLKGVKVAPLIDLVDRRFGQSRPVARHEIKRLIGVDEEISPLGPNGVSAKQGLAREPTGGPLAMNLLTGDTG